MNEPIFSFNYGGEIEQNGVKVEFARAIFMHRDAIEGKSFDETNKFNNHEYVAEVIWRITNNTDEVILWTWGDVAARVNTRQTELIDWLLVGHFGVSPTDTIFPGSTITGGVWFGISNLAPDDIESAALLFGSARTESNSREITGNFIIEVDLSGPPMWFDLPDELRS